MRLLTSKRTSSLKYFPLLYFSMFMRNLQVMSYRELSDIFKEMNSALQMFFVGYVICGTFCPPLLFPSIFSAKTEFYTNKGEQTWRNVETTSMING